LDQGVVDCSNYDFALPENAVHGYADGACTLSNHKDLKRVTGRVFEIVKCRPTYKRKDAAARGKKLVFVKFV
jgi:hypothetical protein